jgi:hypothetical protein
MSWNTWAVGKPSSTALKYESTPADYMWRNAGLQVVQSPTASTNMFLRCACVAPSNFRALVFLFIPV